MRFANEKTHMVTTTAAKLVTARTKSTYKKLRLVKFFGFAFVSRQSNQFLLHGLKLAGQKNSIIRDFPRVFW